jgi:hypothetical protein
MSWLRQPVSGKCRLFDLIGVHDTTQAITRCVLLLEVHGVTVTDCATTTT